MLANERTFAAWMRTGMACVAIAIGLKAIFGATEPTWMAKLVAEFFIVIAIVIFCTAAARSQKAQRRIEEHDATAQSHGAMIATSVMLVIGTASAGILLWIL
ncbi:YidH family protein [Yoonia sp. R2331]|uniref:YidH family protein n=1 Tax=Yoonia sp. R2331 TaxID=3237238 RepID=UPI0034E3FCDB